MMTININSNLIECDTGRSVKIKMPHSSHYDGFYMWYPSRFIGSGRHCAAVSVWYGDGFTFKLKKGKEEIEIDADELKDIFGIVDENITSAQEQPLIHKPAEIAPVLTTADKDLIDD